MSLLNKASLIQIPSGYKDGTLYSAKPTNGDGDFTFSRGSNLAATRVNSDGLIEKGRENLLLQSNTFDTTWSIANASVTSGQSGYDGSSDAWLLSKTGDYGRVEQNTSASGIYTLSVYAKSGTLDWLSFENSGISADTCFFDLSNGVVGSKGAGVVSTSIQSIGNGWYRCSAIFNGTFGISRIQPSISDGVVNGTNGNIYIQDAQLEQGLVATDYIETTTTTEQAGILEDMPRLDYSGGATCGHLLLEPQRSNVYTNSEYFDDWLSNRLDRTANNIISPEGLQNAYKMAQQSGFTTAPNINKGGIAAGTYTISIFAKKGSWNYLAISFEGVSYFNLEAGSKGTINSNHTATIEDYGNGWYRCAITRTTSTTQTPAFYFAESDNTLTTPDTQGYMYTFGAMLEEGSYPTSYIPTYGSSVTRGADSCSKTGISSLIGQTEGTLFVEVDLTDVDSSTTRGIAELNDGGTFSRITLFRNSNGTIRLFVRNGGTAQMDETYATPPSGATKIGIGYASNDIVLYVNGTQVASDTSATIPACSDFYLGVIEGNLTKALGDGVKQALLFKTRLTNDELATLTTI